MSPMRVALYPFQYESVVRLALEEDLGWGDLTTESVVGYSERAVAHLVARASGRIAGLEVAVLAFRLLDQTVTVDFDVHDGADVDGPRRLCSVHGTARALLSAERVALNLLGRLCGIATATREAVCLVSGTGARVVCTRKTTPGLRLLEKYAVRVGGGTNHRFGLDDGILIKDNHRNIAGGVGRAIEMARQRAGHMVKIEAEVETMDQLEEALAADVDAVLLDNMTVEQLRAAVARIDGHVLTEASGGISPATARAVAETGVDLLSLGWLTHSSPSLDVALDLEPSP